MRRSGVFVLGAAVAGLIASPGMSVPAMAGTLSATYAGHRAYVGIDGDFFTGLLLTGQDPFRVDLGAVISKYIGETEKNLAAVFDQLGSGSIVLFFDEADALFGKRSDVKDAHDRFAENFVVLNPVESTWRGQIVLGPDDGVREDGVYELTGRYESLIIAPIPTPPGLALFAAALLLGGIFAVPRQRTALPAPSV